MCSNSDAHWNLNRDSKSLMVIQYTPSINKAKLIFHTKTLNVLLILL